MIGLIASVATDTSGCVAIHPQCSMQLQAVTNDPRLSPIRRIASGRTYLTDTPDEVRGIERIVILVGHMD